LALRASLHYDFLFKVILVGEEEPTKTGLLWAFTGTENCDTLPDYKRTIGVNFGITSVFLNENVIKLQIWDILCNSRVKSLRPFYFKGASGCILVIRNIQEARSYLEEIQNCCHKIIPILFVYINDEPIPAQLDEYLSKLNIEPVTNGFQGIEWLAEAMLSSRKNNEINHAAIYHVGNNEIQNVLETLRQSQLRIEKDRLETIRKQRSIQIELLKDYLNEMGLSVDHDSIQILRSEALFTVNILDGNVSVFPLKCDQCQKYQKACKKEWHLCIVKDSDGWSNDLDSDSLLILSKIYAFLSNKLPTHVLNQINNILRCPDYRALSL
jgi:GTPase SAR1 family protein